MVEQVPLEHLEAQITQLAGHRSAATCRWLLLVAEFDRREGYARWECRSTAHWLNWHCGVSFPAAREHVRVGRAFDGLPMITSAFAAGTISYSKVRAVTRVATPATEETLLEWAQSATAAQLDRIVAGRQTVGRNEAQQLHLSRHLTARHDDDGSLVGSFRLDPDEGAALLAALTRGKDLLRTSVEPEMEEKALPLASTLPSRVLPAPCARPDSAARAASTASAGSDLPVRRRAWRLGRSTSTTLTPSARSDRARLAHRSPCPPRRPERCRRRSAARRAACRCRRETLRSSPRPTGRRCHPARRRRAHQGACRHRPSRRARLRVLRWSSPSLLSLGSRGGTRRPMRAAPVRSSCWRRTIRRTHRPNECQPQQLRALADGSLPGQPTTRQPILESDQNPEAARPYRGTTNHRWIPRPNGMITYSLPNR